MYFTIDIGGYSALDIPCFVTSGYGGILDDCAIGIFHENVQFGSSGRLRYRLAERKERKYSNAQYGDEPFSCFPPSLGQQNSRNWIYQRIYTTPSAAHTTTCGGSEVCCGLVLYIISAVGASS